VNDDKASAYVDLLMFNGDDLRPKPYVERKAALRKLLRHGRGIQYVDTPKEMAINFFRPSASLAWKGSFQRN